jgi:signal transduction histidine kinase
MPSITSAQLLIVDDEAPHLKALCDTLKDQGYVTTGFASAKEALVALNKQKFDLVLTDLLMPEMDGIDFLRAALKIDPRLVGIMMTGHGTISTAVEAMQVGALDYILKPFKLNAILPVLSRALAVRQLRLENAALQQRVSERTAELEVANKELEAFSYSVSHDLRAPLRAIGGFAQILRRESESHFSEQEKQLLDRICSGATQMGELTEGLLNLSRLGRQPLSKQPTNLNDLVRQVLDELSKEREGREVEVRVAALPDCVGDPSLLKQVFVNLLANAFKFTRGMKEATIEVGCLSQNGESVYFVRDNGAGFDMQYAGKLFGAFQRFHSHEQFAGTGVGLSIVQRIIHRHGGRIWAEAEVDKGATFYLTLA